MSVPHYEIEFTQGTQYQFRFDVSIDGTEQDLTTWPNLWHAAKRSAMQADADAVYVKVLFDGVERVSGETQRAEVTILPADTADLEEGMRHRLIGDVGGLDADLAPHQLFTLDITVNPRIRRSND